MTKERVVYNLRDELTYDSPVSPGDSKGSRKRLATGGVVRHEAQRNSLQRGCRRGRAPGLPPLPLFNRAAVESPRTSIRRGCPREVEEGDEASERIVDQEHARRHRTPNHRPLPLRSSTTASCATIIGCVRSPCRPATSVPSSPPSHLPTFQGHRASPCSRRHHAIRAIHVA